jgi:hypothetical protein
VVVGLTGPRALGGGLLLARTGFVWYRARLCGGGGHAAPPRVYGIRRRAPPVTARRPPAPAAAPREQGRPDIIVQVDPGTQVIQTDAAELIRASVRLRGKIDPGEQSLAIDAT